MIEYLSLMRSKTVLHDSFAEHLSALRPFHKEIAYVVKGLELDIYFCPGDEYVTEERDKRGKYFICQHVRGWCGYRLGWYFEYTDNTAIVSKVVIFLLPPPDDQQEPYLTLTLKDPE